MEFVVKDATLYVGMMFIPFSFDARWERVLETLVHTLKTSKCILWSCGSFNDSNKIISFLVPITPLIQILQT